MGKCGPIALGFSRKKGGPIARKAALLCGDPLFRRFLETKLPLWDMATPDEAATALRCLLGIESRVELDHDPAAAARFESLRGEFLVWKAAV